REIAGLGLTGQMHGATFLDAADQPIRPALLWNDQRTAAQCAAITQVVGAERLLAITGNPALTGFQAPKILWLRDAEPANYARVARVLLPKDFVRLRLTGEAATDASDAAGTLLLDVRRRDWSPEILAALGIPGEWLPTVHEGPQVAGRLLPGLAATLGLPPGLPVAAGGGDNAAAAVGTGIIATGPVSVSLGTSGVIFAHTDDFRPDPSGRLHAFCHAVPGGYHLMAVTLAAGGALRWWRDLLGSDDYARLTAEAAAVPPGAEGLLFLPYLSGERTPHLDPAARGVFIGLTARHTRAHLTRAVLEGVVFSLHDGFALIRELGVPTGEVRATGGGARSALWRQILADTLDLPVRRVVAEEGPAYGAALLAGVAAGVWRDLAEAATLVRLRPERDEPIPAGVRVYAEYTALYRSLYPALRGAMGRLTALVSG
ncbi:MAG TPA: xylulokinase, partial [Thermomicrobiales bacterium]